MLERYVHIYDHITNTINTQSVNTINQCTRIYLQQEVHIAQWDVQAQVVDHGDLGHLHIHPRQAVVTVLSGQAAALHMGGVGGSIDSV